MKFDGNDAPALAATDESAPESGQVAFLDATLWARLVESESPAELAIPWLELQCRMLQGVVRACVYLVSEEQHGTIPVAFWPRQADGPVSLLKAARRAIQEKKGVVLGHTPGESEADNLCAVAYPFVIDDTALGAVALEISDRSQAELRELMRTLQWGAGWVELVSRREATFSAELLLTRSRIALDLMAVLLDEQEFATASKALVTDLATRVDCDLVAMGIAGKQQMKVVALSHSAEFSGQMNLVTLLSQAMQEAADQSIVIMYPPPAAGPFQIARAHEGLAAVLQDSAILTIPLLRAGAPVGALLFQRSGREFCQSTVDLCDVVAALAGPVLDQKYREQRSIFFKIRDALAAQTRRLFGPDFLGRKIAFGITALLVLLFSVVQGTYRVAAPARIEGQVQRVVVAPFDGYIVRQFARAGDQVAAGEVLAEIDDRDLSLEHTRWVTTRQQRLAEFDQMMAAKDRSGSKIVAAQIEQADAHVALLAEQLRRTRLVAAFDALVVSGDLSQSVGAAVSRGEQLFELAPLDSYRVILEVDESQVLDIQPGQVGRLKVASLLDTTLNYTIQQVVPITESRDGRNFFRVEALLEEASPGLRPGMEGVGKTEIEDRLLIRIWTRDLFHWLRLKLWAWWP